MNGKSGHQFGTNKMGEFGVIPFLLVRVFFGSFFIFLLMAKIDRYPYNRSQNEADDTLNTLYHNWCRVRNERTDFKSKLKACSFDISWNSSKNDDQRKSLSTDASKSLLSNITINPAGEFSSFMIQSTTKDGVNKTIGGDSWRIVLRGKSTVVPTIFDLANGQYEVMFLMADPGVYKLDITLDYTLCDGYRDPPNNFFIKGMLNLRITSYICNRSLKTVVFL